jgi:phage-related protein
MTEVTFVGDSLKKLRQFPKEVKQEIGFALSLVEIGEKPVGARPLSGFGGAKVLEIRTDHDGDSYRPVYTIKFESAIYVLDAFQKKSSSGIKTPDHIIQRIKSRLKRAEEIDQDEMRKGRRKDQAP